MLTVALLLGATVRVGSATAGGEAQWAFLGGQLLLGRHALPPEADPRDTLLDHVLRDLAA